MIYIVIVLLLVVIAMLAMAAAERTSDNLKALQALHSECDGLRMEIRDADAHIASLVGILIQMGDERPRS